MEKFCCFDPILPQILSSFLLLAISSNFYCHPVRLLSFLSTLTDILWLPNIPQTSICGGYVGLLLSFPPLASFSSAAGSADRRLDRLLLVSTRGGGCPHPPSLSSSRAFGQPLPTIPFISPSSSSIPSVPPPPPQIPSFFPFIFVHFSIHFSSSPQHKTTKISPFLLAFPLIFQLKFA